MQEKQVALVPLKHLLFLSVCLNIVLKLLPLFLIKKNSISANIMHYFKFSACSLLEHSIQKIMQ